MNDAVKNSVINGSNSIEITPLLQCHMCSKNGFTANDLKVILLFDIFKINNFYQDINNSIDLVKLINQSIVFRSI